MPMRARLALTDTAGMQVIGASLELDAWASVEITPLSPKPSDPALANC
jgi:hypothetical protein